MRKKPIILGISLLGTFILLASLAAFSGLVDPSLLPLMLIVGSASIVATSTLYTVVTHEAMEDDRIRQSEKFVKKIPGLKKASFEEQQMDLTEDYLDAIPSIRDYMESDKPSSEFPVLDELIFSKFSPKVLKSIELLNLSQIEKLQFLRELIYFDPEEREELLENMLMNRDKRAGEVEYVPPSNPIPLTEKLRVRVISLVEPGDKMKLMIIESNDSLSTLKEKIGKFFGYEDEDFLLSTGGIILEEDKQVNYYHIVEDDEIVLIPSRKNKKK